MATAGVAWYAECKERLCTVGQNFLERAATIGTQLEQFSTMEFVIEPGCTCRKHDTAKTQTVVNDDQQAYAHAEAPASSDGMLYSAFVPPVKNPPAAPSFSPRADRLDRSARYAAGIDRPPIPIPEDDETVLPVNVVENFNTLWAEPAQILPRPPSTIQSSALVSTAVREAPWSQFMPQPGAPPQPGAGRAQTDSRLVPGGAMRDWLNQAEASPRTQMAGYASTPAPTPSSVAVQSPAPAPALSDSRRPPQPAMPSAGDFDARAQNEEEFSKFMLSSVHEEDNISHISALDVPKITVASTPAAAEPMPPAVKVPMAASLADQKQAPAGKPAPLEKPAPAEKPASAEKLSPAEKARRSDDVKSAIAPSAAPRQSGTLKMGSKGGAAKSVLSQSMVMQSSAAAALGGMLQIQAKNAAAEAAERPSAAGAEAQKPVESSKPPPAAPAARSASPPARSASPQPSLQEKKPPVQTKTLEEKKPEEKKPEEKKPRGRSSDLKSTLSVNTNLNSSAANVLGPLAAAGARGGRGKSSERRSGDLKSTLSMNAPSNSAAATALGSVMSGSGGSSRREGSSDRKKDDPAGKRDDTASVKDNSSVGSKPKGSAVGSVSSRAKVDSKSVISGLNTSSSAASALLGPMMAQQGKPKKRSDRQGGESKSVIA